MKSKEKKPFYLFNKDKPMYRVDINETIWHEVKIYEKQDFWGTYKLVETGLFAEKAYYYLHEYIDSKLPKLVETKYFDESGKSVKV